MSLTSSITSSLVIDTLYEQASKEDIAVVILYCDYQEQHKQTTTNMIGSILKQMAAKDRIPESVWEALTKAKNKCGDRGPRLLDLVAILRELIASLPQAFFICIDALDEFMSKKLPELLVSLRDVVQALPNVRMFLTGRPHVEAQIIRHFTKVVAIPISPKRHDVESYLWKKLEMDEEPHVMDDSLRTDIIRTLHGSLSKSFVRLSIPTMHV